MSISIRVSLRTSCSKLNRAPNPPPLPPLPLLSSCVPEAVSFPRKLAFCPPLAPIHILSRPFRAGQPAEAEARRETLLRVTHLIICCTNMCFACLTIAQARGVFFFLFVCLWWTDGAREGRLRNTKFRVPNGYCHDAFVRTTCDFLFFV